MVYRKINPLFLLSKKIIALRKRRSREAGTAGKPADGKRQAEDSRKKKEGSGQQATGGS